MIRLFIENTELELGEDFSCPITRTFENISNPTQIVSEYSKTITIPHTQSNDKVFGHIYNPDRLVVANQKNEALKGIFFDPYRKIDFRLEWNDSVVMTGYLKVLQVTDKGYECTLNGELGKIFQEMQKITFDENKYEGEDKEKYWIDSSEYVNTKINKELVYESWNSNGPTSTKLRKIGDVGYRFTDIIGYTPNNAFNNDFDYKTHQTQQNTSYTFEDTLNDKRWNNKTFSDITGVAPSTVIGDGLTPRAIGDFRSYLQQPFIYWNQFWQIYQQKVESTTGFKFDLDENWFNNNNIYWTKSVLTLMNFDQIQKQIKDYNPGYDSAISYSEDVSTVFQINDKWTRGADINLSVSTTAPYYDAANKLFNPIDDEILKLNFSKFNIKFIIKRVALGYEKINLAIDPADNSKITYQTLTLNAVDSENNIIKQIYKIVVYNSDAVAPSFDFDMAITKTYDDFTMEGDDAVYYIDKGFFALVSDIDKPFRLSLNVDYVYGDGTHFDAGYAYLAWYNNYPYLANFNTIAKQSVISDSQLFLQSTYYRSGSNFTLSTLWDNSVTPYSVFINYCKQFRILCFVDNVQKTIKFIDYKSYFSKYKIKDYTQKIDKSNNYIIKPITFEKKYVYLNYEDNKSNIGEKYKSSYNYNFGEKLLITKYNFNDEQYKLFSGVRVGIPYTSTDNSWQTLYGSVDGSVEPNIIYITPAELFVKFSDKDNKQIDSFGCLLFAKSADFDIEPDLRDPAITDDTNLMIYTDNYFYSNIKKYSTKYMQLTDVLNDKCILFDVPKENYTYLKSHYEGVDGLYYYFWKKYIEERYNTQNKIVQCYLTLTPSDFVNFQFNNFIIIENQLYLINKIYDYDISSDKPTKVDLITVQNITGYTENNY